MSHWAEGKANLAQSILVQLRNYAREAGEAPQVIQLRYATERLMYRISRSAYADRFVLKGAWLFFLWGDPQRATRDVDFAGHFADSEAEVGKVFTCPETPSFTHPSFSWFWVLLRLPWVRGERCGDTFSLTRGAEPSYAGSVTLMTPH